jgi:putative Ca2+/H+ antiporter (TMEM165/GDT1 family)
VPAVLLGDRVTRWLPIRWVHRIAALVFALLGVLVLLGWGG